VSSVLSRVLRRFTGNGTSSSSSSSLSYIPVGYGSVMIEVMSLEGDMMTVMGGGVSGF
jgi:hypothetical protein